MNEETVIQRPLWVTAVLLAISAIMIVTFVKLGNWQMRRLSQKLDLIEAVDTRAFGAPVSLPEKFDPAQHEYLRVAVSGTVQPDEAVLVKAVTELGPGHWVMMPMTTQQGVLWVNRGFVPPDQKQPKQWSQPETSVSGLLRATQSGGTALESNMPDIDRWVSRDTAAMAQARGLGDVLPYFLDADHAAAPEAWPRGGLTIISFRNSHLSYALTWYAMAVLFAAALVYVIYSSRRQG